MQHEGKTNANLINWRRVYLVVNGESMWVMPQNGFPEPIGLEPGSEISNPHPVIGFAESNVSCYMGKAPDEFGPGMIGVAFGEISRIKENLNPETFIAVNLAGNIYIFPGQLFYSRINNYVDVAFGLIFLCKTVNCYKCKKKRKDGFH